VIAKPSADESESSKEKIDDLETAEQHYGGHRPGGNYGGYGSGGEILIEIKS
jgi:hypothetical protein